MNIKSRLTLFLVWPIIAAFVFALLVFIWPMLLFGNVTIKRGE